MTSFGRPPSKKAQVNDNPLQNSGLTKETQAILQDVMQKRGLSMRAAQDVASSVKGGNGQWVHVLNSGTAAYTAPNSKTQQVVKAPKFHGRHAAMAAAALHPPASFSGKRMKEQIPQPERDIWVTRPPVPDREVAKDYCAQVMEHGSAAALNKKREERLRQQEKQAQIAAKSAIPHENVREVMVDQLISEIQERSEFFESMAAAGKGKEYEHQIKAEIQQRMIQLQKYGVELGSHQASRMHHVTAPWQKQNSDKNISLT